MKSKPTTKKDQDGGETEREKEKQIGVPSLMVFHLGERVI